MKRPVHTTSHLLIPSTVLVIMSVHWSSDHFFKLSHCLKPLFPVPSASAVSPDFCAKWSQHLFSPALPPPADSDNRTTAFTLPRGILLTYVLTIIKSFVLCLERNSDLLNPRNSTYNIMIRSKFSFGNILGPYNKKGLLIKRNNQKTGNFSGKLKNM